MRPDTASRWLRAGGGKLGRIISRKESWSPPFVIQLVGEYVVEILEAIHNNLSSLDSTVYAAFLKENISFWDTTKQRVMSYWDCYYRRTWKHLEDYVGFRIIEHLESLLLRTSGV